MAWYNCRMGGGAIDEDSRGVYIGSGTTQKAKYFTLTEQHIEDYGVDFDELTAENFYMQPTSFTTFYGSVNDYNPDDWKPENTNNAGTSWPWMSKITYDATKRQVRIPGWTAYCSFIGENDQNGQDEEQKFEVAVSYQLYFLPYLKRPTNEERESANG